MNNLMVKFPMVKRNYAIGRNYLADKCDLFDQDNKPDVVEPWKVCTRCDCDQPLSCYSADHRANDGKRSMCKKCIKGIEGERWRQRTDEQKRSHSQRTKQWLADNLIIGKVIHLFNAAQLRARKKKRECNVSKERIKSVLLLGLCQASNLPFRYGADQIRFWRNPFSPSLDRIDNTKGYEDDNVQIVCSMYNAGKGEADELDFIAMCMAVAEKNKDNEQAIKRLAELRVSK